MQFLLNSDLQTRIAELGPNSPGCETGVFDSATEEAVKRFQEKYQAEILAPINRTTGTGAVGPYTIAKLNHLLEAYRLFIAEFGSNAELIPLWQSTVFVSSIIEGAGFVMTVIPTVIEVVYWVQRVGGGKALASLVVWIKRFGPSVLQFIKREGVGKSIELLTRFGINYAETAGIVGERNLVAAWKESGIEPDPRFTPLKTGFDNIGRKGDSIILGESKFIEGDEEFGLKHLKTTVRGARQGSIDWTWDKILELKKNGQTELAEDLAKNMSSVQRHLVITRGKGATLGVAKNILKDFDKVTEVNFSGNILKTYKKIR